MRTPEESRESQRLYRARIAARKAMETEAPSAPVSRLALKPTKMVRMAERRYVPPEGTHSSYQYLPGDHLIGEMTQHQRDHILARMPKTARER